MTKLKAKKIIAKKPVKKKLTLKQKKFTSEYIKTGNATKSAIKAGYSKKTAHSIGSENLKKPEIQADIQSEAEKLGIDAKYVLSGFKEIAEFNKKTYSRKVSKIVGEGDDAVMEVIEEIKMIDASASLKAHEMLGKHLSLFTEKLELTGKNGKDLIVSNAERLSIAAKKIALLLSQANSK